LKKIININNKYNIIKNNDLILNDLIHNNNYNKFIIKTIKDDNVYYLDKYLNLIIHLSDLLYNHSIQYNSIKCFIYLLQKNINIKNDLILECCKYNNEDFIKHLLQNNYYINYNKINNNQFYCYKYVIYFDNYNLLNLLLNNIYIKNIFEYSLLNAIIEENNENIFNILINKKYLINEINEYLINFSSSKKLMNKIENIYYIKNYIKEKYNK
jgi:hypothetical protein